MAPNRPLTSERALERRKQLIAVATEFWSERDYDDVSVDDIAAAAGVSHGLLFQYFESKKGLYLASLDEMIAEARRHNNPDPSLPPIEGLRRAVALFYDWAHEFPQGYRSIVTGGGNFSEARERLDAWRSGGVLRLAEGLKLDPMHPQVAIGLRAWIGYSDSAVLASLDVDEPDREATIDLVVKALLSTGQELHRQILAE